MAWGFGGGELPLSHSATQLSVCGCSPGGAAPVSLLDLSFPSLLLNPLRILSGHLCCYQWVGKDHGSDLPAWDSVSKQRWNL